MALQASGPIDANAIRSEFGATNGTSVRFGAYRVSQTVSALTNLPLDAGIPQSGTIKFSDFYSKKLNVVVDYTVGVGTTTKVTARTDYNANNSKIVVIGNFRQRPVNPAGTKVWIHTNSDIGSDIKTNTKTYSSLLTGTWDSTTELRIDIGPNGRVFGAGGDGGKGADAQNTAVNPGSPGNSGTSGIGISATNSVIVTNRGRIQCGGGGGGGGGSAYARHNFTVGLNNGCRRVVAGGSGGGGGAGFPAGLGGAIGIGTASGCDTNGDVNGNPGVNGTLLTAGKGGNTNTIGNTQCAVAGGAGGGGGTNGLGGTGGTQNSDGYVSQS